MKYYKVPVYKATIVNGKPFIEIEKLGKGIIAKPKRFWRAIEPNTGVPISVQKQRQNIQGLIKVNQDQMAEYGFCLFVYQKDLTDKKQVSEDYYEKWLANLNQSRVYQCCQEMVAEPNKEPYQKTIGRRK